MKKIILIIAIILAICVFAFNDKQKDTCTNRTYSKEYVSYNTKTNIYHSLDCDCAQRCTVNCIVITRDDAVNRGARPCHRCNGGNNSFVNFEEVSD